MRKIYIIIGCLISTISFAQIDLSAVGGYQFGAKSYTSNGTLRLKSSGNYGAMLEIGLSPNAMLQLSYIGAQTYATLDRSFTTIKEDVGVNYYQIGVLRPLPVNDKVQVYGNFTMGATQFNIQDDAYQDEWRFSVTLGLGTKIWLSDVVGIRLHARMLAPINWAGLGFFCGTGGCGISVNAGSTFISGDVGGGLVIRLQP